MVAISHDLDREWCTLAASAPVRDAVARWSHHHPELAECRDLHDVLDLRRQPERAQAVLRALAELSPTDELAARTLLQALIPGLVRLASTAAADDRHAVEEMVSLAWERIRTYPVQRQGSVAGNVLLDVLKRYRKDRAIETPVTIELSIDPPASSISTEDEVMGRLLVGELANAVRHGLVDRPMLSTIVRTRLGGESLADLAAEQSVTRKVLCHRRWRAELRLRSLPLAG